MYTRSKHTRIMYNLYIVAYSYSSRIRNALFQGVLIPTTLTPTTRNLEELWKAPIPKMSGLVRKNDLFSKACIFPNY